jgi:hypothetical protein
MTNYYVAKKNRCRCIAPVDGEGGSGENNCCDAGTEYTKTNFFYSPNNSSMNLLLTRSKKVYTTSLSLSPEKGQGNIQKHGSAGNSYFTYLSRKVGNIGCNC